MTRSGKDRVVNPAKMKLNILGDRSSANSSRTALAVSQIGNAVKLAFEIEVVSDVICPWCWVGKRRLEKAITLLGTDAKVTVTWRPFQLNPSMPKAGIDRNEYRRAKFGSLERSKELDARLTAVGMTEGIEFHLDRIKRTPNTLDAHRLIWLAQKHGKQDAVVEALFKAYFVDGVDVGDPKNLVGIAVSAGIERALAAVDILIVWTTIIWCAVAIWPHCRWVAVAQVPYFVWVSIATVLQMSITAMNS